MAHRWQVSETDQTHVVGTSTNLGGTVDLNITNVINGVNTQTLIFAKAFKIGGATMGGSNQTEWTGGNVGSVISNYSATFDGLGSGADAKDLVTFTQTAFDVDGSTYSFAFWAKKTNATDTMHVFGRTGTGANSYYSRITLDGATDRLYIESDTNGDEAYATVTDDTNWHHYVITVSSGVVAMYQDGSALTVTGNVNGDNLTIDAIGGGGNSFRYNGQIYQPAIWSAVLSASDVSVLYNSGIPVSVKEDRGTYTKSGNLIHLWRFSEGTGTTTSDSVGSLTGTFQDDATFSTTTPDPAAGTVSKVVFSDNGIAGTMSNTVKATVHLNSFTVPKEPFTIFIDIDEQSGATDDSPSLPQRNACIRSVWPYVANSSGPTITDITDITETSVQTASATVASGIHTHSGTVPGAGNTMIAELEFTADTGYAYAFADAQALNLNNGSYDYTNYYQVNVLETLTNNRITSFKVQVIYTPPPAGTGLEPDPIPNMCELSHKLHINFRVIEIPSTVTAEITSVEYEHDITGRSRELPITVRGTVGATYTIQFTKNTSTTNTAIASSNGYYNFSSDAFQTGSATENGTIGANGSNIHYVTLPHVTAETHYSIVLANGGASTTIPTDMDGVGEQMVKQYGYHTASIVPKQFDSFFVLTGQQKDIIKPIIFEGAKGNDRTRMQQSTLVGATVFQKAGNGNSSSTTITLTQLNDNIKSGMFVFGAGAGTHQLKVNEVKGRTLTLSSAIALADDTELRFEKDAGNIHPFELTVASVKSQPMSINYTAASGVSGRQPSLTTDHGSSTTFKGDIAGFDDVVVTRNSTSGTVSSAVQNVFTTTRGIVPGMTMTSANFYGDAVSGGAGGYIDLQDHFAGPATVQSVDSDTQITLTASKDTRNGDIFKFATPNEDGTEVLDIQAKEAGDGTGNITVQCTIKADQLGATQDSHIYVEDFIRVS